MKQKTLKIIKKILLLIFSWSFVFAASFVLEPDKPDGPVLSIAPEKKFLRHEFLYFSNINIGIRTYLHVFMEDLISFTVESDIDTSVKIYIKIIRPESGYVLASTDFPLTFKDGNKFREVWPPLPHVSEYIERYRFLMTVKGKDVKNETIISKIIKTYRNVEHKIGLNSTNIFYQKDQTLSFYGGKPEILDDVIDFSGSNLHRIVNQKKGIFDVSTLFLKIKKRSTNRVETSYHSPEALIYFDPKYVDTYRVLSWPGIGVENKYFGFVLESKYYPELGGYKFFLNKYIRINSNHTCYVFRTSHEGDFADNIYIVRSAWKYKTIDFHIIVDKVSYLPDHYYSFHGQAKVLNTMWYEELDYGVSGNYENDFSKNVAEENKITL